MEEEEKPSQRITNKVSGGGAVVDGNEDDDLVFPGFRFHPTDEELVGFYLKRKVEKKRFSIDIIREIDIYKHDPWDLPNEARHVLQGSGDKDCYFFCLRGRKYRNSIRPNRVTGSGYWKATGIDKPIHDSAGERVGLKKSLVYYRGSASRGSKTDWMMHEFRLPTSELADLHDAEIWTICRIFKRSTSYNRRCPQQQQKQQHGIKRSQQQQQQQFQYSYDYYRYQHQHPNVYFHSSETAYAATATATATEHLQPFLLHGFHGSSLSSSAEMMTKTASTRAPLPQSKLKSTPGQSDGASLWDSGSTWDELGRIMEI